MVNNIILSHFENYEVENKLIGRFRMYSYINK